MDFREHGRRAAEQAREGGVKSMNYQLVLQFPANSIADYDEMIALEDELIERVGATAKVDGHDCGSGEMNIFICADEPNKILEMIQPVVAKRKMFRDLIAAYREVAGEDYTVIWPTGFTKQFRIT